MSECIFICDRDPSIKELCIYIFKTRGYETVGCGNDQDFIKEFSRRKPDIILMDFLFPDTQMAENVFQFLTDTGETIPVILFSVVSDIENAAAEFGVETYLQKPFNLSDLLMLVDQKVS